MKFKVWLFIVGVLSFSINVQAQERTAFVHLFEWSWLDIAIECEDVLGPNGFKAVQVSPPQKSDTGGSEWWRSYQPVSYALESNKGNRDDFSQMVSRCAAVGVDIYVDLVVNHMAAWDRVFPEVPYFPEHFHNCHKDIDYKVRFEVQNCDLLELNDLKTEDEYVRSKIADYINDLVSLGVKGLRIDAAKHIPADDIANILARVPDDLEIFLEVIGAGDEPIKPAEYIGMGRVTEFNFERTIGHFFLGRGPLRELGNIGIWDGWLASDDAVVFVSNHDDQRGHASEHTLTFNDGIDLYLLGEIFTLAYPYGYPKVMSSFYFSDFDQGAPANGPNTGDSCFDGGWVCEHRKREILNMVKFRNITASEATVSNWWDRGDHQIAFGRGDKGFVVINRDEQTLIQESLQTGLPEGEYCDVVNGDYDAEAKSCSGPTVLVDSNGVANFRVASIQAAAIHVGAVVDPLCIDDCPSDWAQAYFRGTPNDWGVLPMQREGELWVTEQNFGGGDVNGGPRFKVSRFEDWSEAFPSSDYRILDGAGKYRIEFDSQLEQIVSVTKLSDPDSIEINFNCDNGYTYSGQSVYVVGSIAALGHWNPVNALRLTPSAYPTWTGSVKIPFGEQVHWKCLKREELNPSAGLEWQQGNDNNFFSLMESLEVASF